MDGGVVIDGTESRCCAIRVWCEPFTLFRVSLAKDMQDVAVTYTHEIW